MAAANQLWSRISGRPALINLPFFIAGTLKIIYDLLLYREFVAVQPPESLEP